MDSTWKWLAKEHLLNISKNLNTNIIVNYIWNSAKTLLQALAYIECQFRMCWSQELPLSLKKGHFFPKRI